ncbi:hypothetical protein OAO01_09265 [Oligoflexia bacterium]|nr:hypothetical protein [Oligoflexia bacterium]
MRTGGKETGSKLSEQKSGTVVTEKQDTKTVTKEIKLSEPRCINIAEQAKILESKVDHPAVLLEVGLALMGVVEPSGKNLGNIALQRAFQLFLKERRYSACVLCIEPFRKLFLSSALLGKADIDLTDYSCSAVGMTNALLTALSTCGADELRALDENTSNKLLMAALSKENLIFLTAQNIRHDLQASAFVELTLREKGKGFQHHCHPQHGTSWLQQGDTRFQIIEYQPEETATWHMRITLKDNAAEQPTAIFEHSIELRSRCHGDLLRLQLTGTAARELLVNQRDLKKVGATLEQELTGRYLN